MAVIIRTSHRKELKGPLGVESLDRGRGVGLIRRHSQGDKPASRKSAPPQEGSRELLPLTPPPLAPDYDERSLGIASARERTTVTCRRMKSVCDERERIPLPTRDATMTMMQLYVAPNTEADPVALGSPQTKYRLVIGKEQTPLQERTSGVVRESGWERHGAELYLAAVAAEKDQRPPARNPYRPNHREPTPANLRRIRANADSPIEYDPRYADDVECQDEEFSRCDAG
jgi:hypothetical protein